MHTLIGRLSLRALGVVCAGALACACSSSPSVVNGSGSTNTGTAAGSVGAGTGSGASSGTGSQGSGVSMGSGVTAGTGSAASGVSATGPSGSATSGGVASGNASTSGAGSDGGAMPAGEAGAGSGSTAGTAMDAGSATPSAGCGSPPNQALMTYVEYMETITLPAGTNALWKNRDYYVWLPAGYDPARAYTTVFLGPGCGGTGKDVVPVQMASTSNAILIGLDPDPAAEGRPCFNTESPTTPEVPYFDETLKEVEAKFCIDTSRIFVAGFSSGSWLADTLGCVRAGVIRGQGNAAGELQGGLTCTGPIAAMMVHDTTDDQNSYQQDYSGERADLVMRNGCTTQTMPYDPGVAPGDVDLMGKPIQCVEYQGCKPGYPLVWCPTTGYGHNDQVGSGLSAIGWWKFWEQIP
jgi:polyhydroxybutyrate depolymerase